jgi:hypothetical protein
MVYVKTLTPALSPQQLHPILAPTNFTVHVLGLYSETGFHIGMDRNFVCLLRRHNCN